MQRSKHLAMAFLLGALLVGGVLGFTADRVFARGGECTSSAERNCYRIRFADDLKLTAVQRAAVDSILDKRNHDMNEVMAPVKPALDSLRAHSRADIMRLLDSTQQGKFQRWIEESNAPAKNGKSSK